MKVSGKDIGGIVKRQNDVYIVIDNENLSHLTLSKTILHPGKQTNGHSHDNLEEIYFFIQGTGIIIVGDDEFEISSGDVVLIPAGSFHQVKNRGRINLEFLCVFEKYIRDDDQ